MKALYLFVVVIPPPSSLFLHREGLSCSFLLFTLLPWMWHFVNVSPQLSPFPEVIWLWVCCMLFLAAHFTSCSILLPCGLNLFIHIFHMLGNFCSYLYDVQIFSIWSTLVEQEYIVPLAQYCIRLYFSRGLRCDKSKDIHVCYAFSFPFCHDSMVITDSKADVISSGVARDNSLLLMTPLEVFSLSRRKGFILRLWKIFI